jgi:hypothetical protein
MIDSLQNQTYKNIKIIPVITGVNCKPIKNNWALWMDNIMFARNACLSAMVDQDFAVINDNDCIHLFPDNIQVMKNAFIQDSKLACIALRKNNSKRSDHISVGCMMFPFLFYKLGIKFRYNMLNCECTMLTTEIKNMGFKCEYIDDKVRINNLSSQKYIVN